MADQVSAAEVRKAFAKALDSAVAVRNAARQAGAETKMPPDTGSRPPQPTQETTKP